MSNEKLNQLESLAKECVEILASQAESAPVVAVDDDAAISAAMAEGNKHGVASTTSARIVAAFALAQRAASVEVQPIAEVSGSSLSDAGWHATVRWLEFGKFPRVGTKLYTAPPAQAVMGHRNCHKCHGNGETHADFCPMKQAASLARLERLLGDEFDCYRTTAGLIPWAINALLDNSPHRMKAAAGVPHIERDAARYRFLRDTPWYGSGTSLERVIAQQRNAHWDASIDAAMSAQGDTGGDHG